MSRPTFELTGPIAEPDFQNHTDHNGYRVRVERLVERVENTMDKKPIDLMVDRFLGWKLPADFNPDGGVTFKPTYNDHLPTPMKNEPIGTNLLTAIQAKAMLMYVLGLD